LQRARRVAIDIVRGVKYDSAGGTGRVRVVHGFFRVTLILPDF
jgi:hypothetical protein